MRRTSKKHCYFCGSPATSGEHVPPKQMFKTFVCDSITVPSCDKHNSKKSGHDQAIVSAFLIPLHTGRNRYPLEPEIEQAIDAALPSFESSKRLAVKSPFLKDAPEDLANLPDLAHLEPSVNVAAWIIQLTAGLVYSKLEAASSTIRWTKATAWSPDWFPTNMPGPISHDQATRTIVQNQKQKVILDKLAWFQGWSAHPRPYPDIIYSFQIHISRDKHLIFRHKFYNRYTWYVTFTASNRCINKIRMNLS